MPLKYRGSGTQQEVSIVLYGDGSTSVADINLSVAPFGIDFKSNFPSLAYLVGEQAGTPNYPDLTVLSLVPGVPPTAGILHLEFESPLPAVTYGQSDEVGGPSTGIGFTIRFIYG